MTETGTNQQQQRFTPGMEFRQFDIQGVCRVMEEAPDGNVAFRGPNGDIHHIDSTTLHRRLFISKEFIQEPVINQPEDIRRIWIISEKIMVYNPFGVTKTGEGWAYWNNDNQDRPKYYKLFRTHSDKHGVTYFADDLVFMSYTGIGNGRALLYSYDAVTQHSSSTGEIVSIIVPTGRNFMVIDYTGKKQILTHPLSLELNKVGNIFENPEYYDIFVKSQHTVEKS